MPNQQRESTEGNANHKPEKPSTGLILLTSITGLPRTAIKDMWRHFTLCIQIMCRYKPTWDVVGRVRSLPIFKSEALLIYNYGKLELSWSILAFIYCNACETHKFMRPTHWRLLNAQFQQLRMAQ